MTRILLIETASPKRVREKAEQIFKSGAYADPEVLIVCNERNRHKYEEVEGIKVHALSAPSRHSAIKELIRNQFDIAFAFWTGEKQYRRWKLLGLRLKAKKTCIISGDGNEFRLTWKAICRHSIFRLRHPLPTDHWDYVENTSEKRDYAETSCEKVLVIQSTEPGHVLKALDRLKREPVFTNPSFTIFCRNRPEILGSFQGNPLFQRVIGHSEARDSWSHLRSLRRQHFDAIVLFLTGDPSYWKVKLFAFLLGSRRILIFNETNDCFFFNLRQWLDCVIRTPPLPTDHRDYVENTFEKVLVIQSAEPGRVIKALDRLKREPVFINPSFTVFCRNRPEILGSFQGNPLFQQVIGHSEARGSWNHLRSLRRQHFDAIMLFLTGDPSYWKVKLFAFLLGSRRILIFNESNDCFFFNLYEWLALISHRTQGGMYPGSKWSRSTRILLSLILKSIFLPFRFVWLLLVWLRLRVAGLKWSRKRHDCSL